MIWEEHKIKSAITITDIFSLFEYHFNNDWNFLGEAHDFWECVYVINGSIRVSGDGRVYTLNSGEMIFHKPMEFHKLSLLGLDCADVFIFSFNAEGSLLPFFREKVFSLSIYQKNIITELLSYMRSKHKDYDISKVKKEYRYIHFYKDDDCYLQTVISYLYILLIALADSGTAASYDENPDAVLFHNAVSYMKRNIDKNINLTDIAGFSKTSVSTLKRIFAKYLDIPVHRYYIMLKIQKATELLESGCSVCETSDILNFSSQGHFSKTYKKITGKNPCEIIRRNS